jgi:hypothetical protein
MEVNMLDLGAQRLRLLAIQAKADEKAATSDAISSSNLQQQTLQANYDELAGRLHRAKKNRGRFVSSIGSEARAKRENITPMKGELGQQFGNVTPAQYLLELDQSIIDMEKKLQGMGI